MQEQQLGPGNAARPPVFPACRCSGPVLGTLR